ncbi:hypothetical protein [Oligoflexus tunisiensis]|uniref:hypothetical protein n=1 Tax=Oligoflexus tunisiensis TaxID=708132 RepID=UPI00114C9D39|nr:hypothetical protein [Oligoflexus tunisiensis]
MRTKSHHIGLSLLMYGSMLLMLACQGADPSESNDPGPADVETGWFNLSKEAQAEVLGTQVKSMGEMRKELMARADADGDGVLSEAEKAELRADWKDLKDEMKAALKAELDKDGDGDVSQDEKKEGLEGMGQKIKEAIQSKHEEMRAAQEAARAKIKEACAAARGKKDADVDVKAEQEACKAVRTEEKEKLQAQLKENLDALKAEIDELKGMLATVEVQSTTL